MLPPPPGPGVTQRGCTAGAGAGAAPEPARTHPPPLPRPQWLLNEPLAEAFRRLLDLQLQRGVALVDVLQQLHP